jgi:hypothetical protein
MQASMRGFGAVMCFRNQASFIPSASALDSCMTRRSDARSPAQNHLARTFHLHSLCGSFFSFELTFIYPFYLAFAAACSINSATSFG